MKKAKEKDFAQLVETAEQGMEQRILEAAGEVFVEKGFAAATTTEIARRAGCNQALVHYYYRTKENLFNQFFEQKVRWLFGELISAEAGEGSFGQKLSRMVGIHFDILRQNANLVFFVINEMRRVPEWLPRLKEKLGELPMMALGTLQRELQAEIKAGRVRPIELVDLILNVVSLNVFLFAVKPAVAATWGVSEGQMEEFTDHRKEEIVRTLLLSLRPE